MEEETTSREEVAYHESGHAVAAVVLGRAIEYVTIKPDDKAGTLGHLRNKKFPGSFQPDVNLDRAGQVTIENELRILYAGGIAGSTWSGKPNPEGCAQDYRCAVDIASYIHFGGDDLDDLLTRMHIDAEELVHEAWPAVEAVALALLERERLTGEEITAIAAPHLPAGRPGEVLALRFRLGALETALRELTERVNCDRFVIRAPSLVIDHEGKPIAELTAEGVLVKRPPLLA